MSNLDKSFLEQLLIEDAQQTKSKGGGRTKVDPTTDRSYAAWYKLHHHLCTSDCPHRLDAANPTLDPSSDRPIGNACWNPNCVDPRDKVSDQGTNIVIELKGGQYICRYCYLSGYLLNE